jgi:mono/diheme cytochrome c family protein
MKRLAMVATFGLAAVCSAQNNVVKRGEQVFSKSCATGYCHGPRGASSGAPRLAGRGFDPGYINSVLLRGIAGTSMSSFAAVLPQADLAAVGAYVAALNGISISDVESEKAAAPTSTGPALTGDAARGARLFSEAVRGFGRCSTCHQIGDRGISVAGPMLQVPPSVGALKALATPNVKTGILAGESMPALVLSDGKQSALFYDLTSLPPVQRNAEPGSVTFTAGSAWRHTAAIGAYNDAELDAILAYLRAVTNPNEPRP